ncbi:MULTISPECIES: acyltransferase family protein [Mesonia]|uniref:Uncharacterized protein n=1 Tax=Mesonia oceanica TaxID=2687242 RepID=A0AC61YAA1_9FLAO|nr:MULTISPECIES: acyltransferase [Mesonia]MAN26646.1 hypothetical protein [Mesonia sp.]MAQ40077.1 hypothetical protein [Mesonia sp.]MBJ96621.1 hypothetical protein [Flavobacteriaceae bacterium]VVV01314.1 hypothetical protein FVB9532_02604 [Mesonia oceanica]|tara:strand:- start:34878 stop:35894 length:1017 start_codon:yes stop_codon:yes gene_type:complete
MFGILRTILAINVILLHIFNIPTLGNYSVTFFFMLSGFLMTLVVNEKYGYSIKGFKVFWINRILRLFPIYWIVGFITIIVLFIVPAYLPKHPAMFFPNSLSDWVFNVTMIFPNIVPHRITPRLIPPSWAITNELVYYLLISLGISKNKRITIFWFFASVAYYIFTYLFYDLATFRYSAIPAASLAFSIGALMYWYKEKFNLFTKPKKIIIVFLVTSFYINGFFSSDIQKFLIKDISIYINLILAFLLITILFNLNTSKKIRKVDNYIGMYSYPFYISHYLVALIYIFSIGYGGINNSFKLTSAALPFYFLLLIIFTFLLIHFIDYPIEAYRSHIKKKA